MRASYQRAIEWIALNDESGEQDVDVVAGMISTVLVADLWGKPATTVARAVIRLRKREALPRRVDPGTGK